MKVRAKFRVSRIEATTYSPDYIQNKVFLAPIYDADSPEDQRYAKATPSGEMWMIVDNPPALAEFAIGKYFYIDFTPIDAQA